jgi:hypothetical protein
MHRKHSHWRNLFRCLLQLSPIALTSSLAVDAALSNRVNALPVPQPATPLHSPVPETVHTHFPSPESTLQPAPCLETIPAGEPGTIPDTIAVEQFHLAVDRRFFPQEELKHFTDDYLNKTQYCSDNANLTPSVPFPSKGREQFNSHSRAGEGLGERSTEQNTHSNRDSASAAAKADRTPSSTQDNPTANQPQPHHLNPLSSGTSPSIETSYSATVGTSQQEAANVLGRGDGLSVGYIHTEESHDWLFSYTLPLNDRDGTLSFAYAQSQYDPINPPVEQQETSKNSSQVESVSRSYELTLRQPIIRSIQGESAEEPDRQPTVAEFALGVTAFLQENPAISLETPFSPSPSADNSEPTRTLALRFFQEWKRHNARELIELRSQFSIGLNTFSSTINNLAAEVNQVPATTFFSWQGQAQWSRHLASDTLLLVRGNVQLTDRSLVPSEQFAIGGVQSVRGYLQDSLFSDNGIFASAELQLPVLRVFKGKGVIQVVPFVDFGTVWNSSGQRHPSPNTLASVGFGLQWQQGNFTARLDWGIPLVSLDASDSEALLLSADRTSQDNGLYFSVQYHP